MSIDNVIPDRVLLRQMRSPGPIDATWQDVWRAVTPIWGVLALSRVAFYSLERLRFPAIAPSVTADVIQSILLWPLVVLGCYLTVRTWRSKGLTPAIGMSMLTTAVFGAVARPAYALGSLVNSHALVPRASDQHAAATQWLHTFSITSAREPD